MTTAIVIPSHNSQTTIVDTLKSVSNVTTILVDNASNDKTISLAKDSHQLLQIYLQEELLSRTESWNRAIRTFLKSNHQWMKWLFTGDRLLPNASQLMQEAKKHFPEARMIIFDMVEVFGEKKVAWQPAGLKKSTLMPSREAIKHAARYGNWFGPPLVHYIHREALEALPRFGGLPWVADMEIALNIAHKFPVGYFAEPIGEFHHEHRNFFMKYRNSERAIFEESLMQLKAIEFYEALSGDVEACEKFRSSIQFQAVKRLIQCNDLSIFRHLKEKLKQLFD